MAPTRAPSRKHTVRPAKRAPRGAFPDALDFRDRPYVARVHGRPPARIDPPKLPVLNQGDTGACTGFALATAIHLLNRADGRSRDRVSPWMLYSMARRYDDIRGSNEDSGSSVRGAMKGWHKHGACGLRFWPDGLTAPPVPDDPRQDWWLDAVRRPLGAYFRIDARDLASIHCALHEVGVVVASAACHSGWDEGHGARDRSGTIWEIPRRTLDLPDGHAFAIVGYDEAGFIVQNSWGDGWGTGGLAVLTYQDWLEHGMDCWVAQLGVVTEAHVQVAESPTLRHTRNGVELPANEALRRHQIIPYVVNTGNDGRLSDSGDYRTTPDDVRAIFDVYLARARQEWGLREDEGADIAIYAHGGLVSEKDAAATAVEWIPALYGERIFPIFLMWETGFLETLGNVLREAVRFEPPVVAGVQDWWNERVERFAAGPGGELWDEMKENGEAISAKEGAGGHLLYQAAMASPAFELGRDRVHLIGHSAGAIVHCRLAEIFCRDPAWRFETANFMAPAASVAMFDATLRPLLAAPTPRMKTYNQWHLSEPLEQKDSSMRVLLLYGRSLLYLVSEALETARSTPLLGMQKYFDAMGRLPNMHAWTSVGPESHASRHGDFDNDAVTRRSVVGRILAGRAAR
jgi:hypothetical protein